MQISSNSHTDRSHFTSLTGVLVASLLIGLTIIACLQKQELQAASPNSLAIEIPTCTFGRPYNSDIGPPQVINVELDFDEKLFWNGREISPQELRHRLDRVARYTPNVIIQLKANQLSSFGSFFKTMKTMQLSGVNTIGIQPTMMTNSSH